jgi:membrane protein required for colicin V production
MVAALLVAGFTPIPADPWWQESRTIQRMMPLVDWAASWLPESIAGHLDFQPELPGVETAPEDGDGSAPEVDPEPREDSSEA